MAPDISKLKSFYQQLDKHQAAGEDVVAELKKEINNLELSYLKEKALPEIAKFIAAQFKDLHCEIDSSFHFDGSSTLNYSFCVSNELQFIKNSIDTTSTEIPDISPIIPSSSNQHSKGSRRMFSINGSYPLNKRNVVYETIKKYMEYNPESTIEDIKKIFPGHIQGSYGVVATEMEYQRRLFKGQDVDKRYFINKPLTDSVGQKFYVCHQWGNNFPTFQRHVENVLGWKIEEV